MRYPQRHHANARMPLSPNRMATHHMIQVRTSILFVFQDRPSEQTTDRRRLTIKRASIDRSIDCEIPAFHSVTKKVHSSVAS